MESLGYIEVYEYNQEDFGDHAETLTLAGIVDNYISAIWTEQAHGSGNFEIVMPLTETAYLLLRQNNVIVFSKNYFETQISGAYHHLANVGIINSVNVNFSKEQGYVLKVKGTTGNGIYDLRSTYAPVLVNTTPAPLTAPFNTNELTEDFFSATSGTLRVKSCLKMVFSKLYSSSMIFRPSNLIYKSGGENALIVEDATHYNPAFYGTNSACPSNGQTYGEYAYPLCKGYYLWLHTPFDFSAGVFRPTLKNYNLVTIESAKSNPQTINPIILSAEMGNVKSFSVSQTEENAQNAALINGDRCENWQVWLNLGFGDVETYGMRRREFVINSSTKISGKDASGDEYTYPLTDYLKLLGNAARSELYKRAETLNITCEIDPLYAAKNQEVRAGTVVSVVDGTLGINSDFLISETTETQDQNGYSKSVKLEQVNLPNNYS